MSNVTYTIIKQDAKWASLFIIYSEFFFTFST